MKQAIAMLGLSGALLLGSGPIGVGGGADAAVAQPASQRAEVSLVAELDALLPGRVNYLGVVLDMDEGWHIYWPGQNATGFPPYIELGLPEGWTQLPTRHPAPERYVGAGDLLDFVHEGRVLLTVPVRVPADAEPGKEITLRWEAGFLICRTECEMGEASGEIALRVARGGEGVRPTASASVFAEARGRAPAERSQMLDRALGLSLRVSGDTAVLAARRGPLSFAPAEDSVQVEDLLSSGVSRADARRLRLTLDPGGPGGDRLRGVLRVGEGERAEFVWIDEPLGG